MRGANEFRLNDATMIEAVQEYLDKRFVGRSPRVQSVAWDSTAQVFRVEVNGDADKPGPSKP